MIDRLTGISPHNWLIGTLLAVAFLLTIMSFTFLLHRLLTKMVNKIREEKPEKKPSICPHCTSPEVHAFIAQVIANDIRIVDGKARIMNAFHPTTQPTKYLFVRCEGCKTEWTDIHEFLKIVNGRIKEDDGLETVVNHD